MVSIFQKNLFKSLSLGVTALIYVLITWLTLPYLIFFLFGKGNNKQENIFE